MRTLLRALGTKNEARYNLKIIDTGGPGGHGPAADDAGPAATATDDSAAPAKQTDVSDDEESPVVVSDSTTDDVLSKTRAELAEFDDLDV